MMNQWTARVLGALLPVFWSVALACSGAATQETGGNQGSELASRFARLEALCFVIQKGGATPSTEREIRSIKEFFESRSKTSSPFLVGQLTRLNTEEITFLKKAGGSGAIPLFWDSLKKDGRAADCKFVVAHILSGVYPDVDREQQEHILNALIQSYTPSTFEYAHPTVLDWAVLRIGPTSIPYLFKLANSENERLRCIQAANLDDLAKRLTGSSVHPVRLAGTCMGKDPHLRRKTLVQWKTWWEDTGRFLPFPSFPDYFDDTP